MHYANIMFLSYSLPLLPDATFCMTFGEALGAMFCATLDITFSTMFFSVTFCAMFDTAFCAIFGSTFWPDTRYALPKSAFTASHYSKISAHHDFLQHFHKIKFAVTVKNRIFAIPIRNGALAERLGTGLQNLLQRFDSARHLSTSLSENPRGIFFDNSSLHLHKIFYSACSSLRQATPTEKIVTETRIETVYETDTVYLEVPQIVEKVVTKDTVSVLENEFAKSAASVSDGLLAHSLETKPAQKPVEVQTKIVYRDSIVYQDRVVTEILEVEKELTGWQFFKMKMGCWFLGILIILIVLLILYFVKPLKLIKL